MFWPESHKSGAGVRSSFDIAPWPMCAGSMQTCCLVKSYLYKGNKNEWKLDKVRNLLLDIKVNSLYSEYTINSPLSYNSHFEKRWRVSCEATLFIIHKTRLLTASSRPFILKQTLYLTVLLNTKGPPLYKAACQWQLSILLTSCSS